MLDDIYRYCIYTLYFICRDSLCWLTGSVKLAREICFRSERKHVQQSVSRSQHAVRAASQGDLFTVRAKTCDLNMQWERGKSRARVWFLFLWTDTAPPPRGAVRRLHLRHYLLWACSSHFVYCIGPPKPNQMNLCCAEVSRVYLQIITWFIYWSERRSCNQRSNLGRPLF